MWIRDRPFEAGSAFLLAEQIATLSTPDVEKAIEAFLTHPERDGSTGRANLLSELDRLDQDEAEGKADALLLSLIHISEPTRPY